MEFWMMMRVDGVGRVDGDGRVNRDVVSRTV